MNHPLIFRFLDANRVEWRAADGIVQSGDLSRLAAYVGIRPVLLAIAGEMVLLTAAEVPGRNYATRIKAVPYVLEEQLADEIEQLHFAIAPAAATEPLAVAVVNRDSLAAWLEACSRAGLTVTAAVPEPLLIPYQADTWSVVVEAERALVRCGPYYGFTTERACLPVLLRRALEETAAAPSALQWWGPDVATDLPVPVRIQASDVSALTLFNHTPAAAIDLLQGPFSRRRQLGKWLRPWRAAAILAGIWLGLGLVWQISEYQRLLVQSELLQTALETTFRQALPDVRRLVNPRVQMENRLRQLRGTQGGADSGLFELLYRSGTVLVEFGDIELRALRYAEQRLDLDLAGSALETFDRLRARLEQQGSLHVTMRTTKRDARVESRVSLSGVAL